MKIVYVINDINVISGVSVMRVVCVHNIFSALWVICGKSVICVICVILE